MGYLTGANGEKSSKRLVGISYAVLGIVMVLGDTFLSEVETSFDILLLVVSVALASLGISSLEYFAKSDIIKKADTTNPTKPGGGKT